MTHTRTNAYTGIHLTDLGLSTLGVDLQRALRAIPKEQADAVLYCDVLGFSEREAAVILGTSNDLIHKRRMLAMQKLRKVAA